MTNPAMTIACASAAGHQLRLGTSPAMTKIVRRDDKPGRDGVLCRYGLISNSRANSVYECF
jgi:hypothetical protein